MRKLLSLLPSVNCQILKAIMEFLHYLKQFSQYNKVKSFFFFSFFDSHSPV